MDLADKEVFHKGDAVVVRRSCGRDRLDRVERVTKTLVICEGGGRYRVRDGWQSGGGSTWRRTQIVKATDADVARIRAAERKSLLEYRFTNLHWYNVDLETLEKVAELVGDRG